MNRDLLERFHTKFKASHPVILIEEYKLSISDNKVRYWEIARGCQGAEVHLLCQLSHDAVLHHQRRELRAPGEADVDGEDSDHGGDRCCWSRHLPWPRAWPLPAPCLRGPGAGAGHSTGQSTGTTHAPCPRQWTGQESWGQGALH